MNMRKHASAFAVHAVLLAYTALALAPIILVIMNSFKERKAIFGGAKGWMIIDTSSGVITGPLTDAEVEIHSEVRGITLLTAAEAWKRLH